nr:hypothetical protein [uncultured Enterobacter sp.]
MNTNSKGSFVGEGKESICQRVFQLIDRYPSRSAAARAWKININTLKNYFRPENIDRVPRRSQLLKIAEVEGVSFEWLLTGKVKETKEPNRKTEVLIKREHNDCAVQKVEGTIDTQVHSLDAQLAALLSFLNNEEKALLVETLARKGIEVILTILDEDLMKLAKAKSNVKKAALMFIDLPDAKIKEILAANERTELAQIDTLNKRVR